MPREPRAPRLLLLNKPFDVLCQFTDEGGRRTLAEFVDVPGVYAAGRLDRDSEGLVLLTGDGALQHRVAHPRHKLVKRYLVQVDGAIDARAVRALLAGVELRDGPARAVAAALVEPPDWLWPRDPPVRHRASIPTSWLALELDEGRNRQVRRMTAAVGHPTLRLVRTAIGPFALDGLAPGEYRHASADALPDAVLGPRPGKRPGGRTDSSTDGRTDSSTDGRTGGRPRGRPTAPAGRPAARARPDRRRRR